MEASQTIIHLAENRGYFQTDTIRSLITFSNQTPNNDLGIVKFNETTLLPQKTSPLTFKEDCYIILLPLVGAIKVNYLGETTLINAGGIGCYGVKKFAKILIQNSYETDLVNYVEICLKTNQIINEDIFLLNFDLDFNKNKLVEVTSLFMGKKIFIGKFGGREESTLQDLTHAFVYVINGVFEVNNCLIETGSGLSLSQINEIEFEGLGFENIILILSKN